MAFEKHDRDDLISLISDAHKDAYGFRPRHNWSEWGREELETFAVQCCQEAQEACERERELERRATDEYEATLARIQREHDLDRHAAMRWLFDASDVRTDDEMDVDRFFWEMGVSFVEARRYHREYMGTA